MVGGRIDVHETALRITPIRPPRVKSADLSPAALRSSATSETRSGPRDSDFISIIGCRARESLCTKHLSRVNPAVRCRGGGRGLLPRPRNSFVPSYRPIQRRAGSSGVLAMASYLRARVRGRAYIRGSECKACVEREEASNQTKWLPGTNNGLQLYAGLAPSPP